MQTTDSTRPWRLAALALLAAVLVLPAGTAAAGHSRRTGRRRATAHHPGDIVVHGRWTITVRDPNGRFVRRYRFENSYAGGPFLARVLGRTLTVGSWNVVLDGLGCEHTDITVQNSTCTIYETNSGPADTFSHAAPGLSVVVNGSRLVLSGSVDAPASGTIREVSTSNDLACAGSQGCPGSGFSTFTRRLLNGQGGSPNQLTVTQGQQIAVTVTLSFT